MQKTASECSTKLCFAGHCSSLQRKAASRRGPSGLRKVVPPSPPPGRTPRSCDGIGPRGRRCPCNRCAMRLSPSRVVSTVLSPPFCRKRWPAIAVSQSIGLNPSVPAGSVFSGSGTAGLVPAVPHPPMELNQSASTNQHQPISINRSASTDQRQPISVNRSASTPSASAQQAQPIRLSPTTSAALALPLARPLSAKALDFKLHPSAAPASRPGRPRWR
jgi:hypothetical protein